MLQKARSERYPVACSYSFFLFPDIEYDHQCPQRLTLMVTSKHFDECQARIRLAT